MFTRVLAGTDGSATAEHATVVAMQVAAAWNAELHVISVADDEAAAREVLGAVERLAADAGVACVTAVSSGHPGRAICEHASAVTADLVVVGDKGMHGVNRLLSGSVPNFVAHNAPCSVLLVDTTRRVPATG